MEAPSFPPTFTLDEMEFEAPPAVLLRHFASTRTRSIPPPPGEPRWTVVSAGPVGGRVIGVQGKITEDTTTEVRSENEVWSYTLFSRSGVPDRRKWIQDVFTPSPKGTKVVRTGWYEQLGKKPGPLKDKQAINFSEINELMEMQEPIAEALHEVGKTDELVSPFPKSLSKPFGESRLLVMEGPNRSPRVYQGIGLVTGGIIVGVLFLFWPPLPPSLWFLQGLLPISVILGCFVAGFAVLFLPQRLKEFVVDRDGLSIRIGRRALRTTWDRVDLEEFREGVRGYLLPFWLPGEREQRRVCLTSKDALKVLRSPHAPLGTTWNPSVGRLLKGDQGPLKLSTWSAD